MVIVRSSLIPKNAYDVRSIGNLLLIKLTILETL